MSISPPTDPTFSGRSMRTNSWKNALLSPKFARKMMRLYIGDHDPEDPLISHLHAFLGGLPPCLVQVGGDEILLDDALRFSEAAELAGTDVTLDVWPHMWHVWHTCVSAVPEAREAIEHIARFMHAQLDKN